MKAGDKLSFKVRGEVMEVDGDFVFVKVDKPDCLAGKFLWVGKSLIMRGPGQ